MDDVITVAYVWGFGNIGDAAITPGLLSLLGHHFPDHRAAVVAEAAHERVRAYLRHDFPQCEVLENGLGRAYDHAIAAAKNDLGGTLPSFDGGDVGYVFDTFAQNVVEAMKRDNPQFMSVLLNTRLLIYNSGMILVYGEGTLAGTDFWGYTVRRSLPLLVANKLGIPYGVYAHSFDSFDGEPGQLYFRRLLNEAAFVFCRDGDSLEYLRHLDIGPPDTMFVPDSTFSFADRDDRWAEAFMTEHGLKSREFIVVIPRTWLGDGVISSSVGERRSKAHIAKLRQIIEGWVRKTGMEAVIAVEVGRELPNAKRFLYDALSEDVRRQCTMVEDFWLAEQAAALYRHTRILITMELHSFLLAIPQGTPAIVPTFRESGRKIWMLRDFKLGEHMFDIDSASTETIEHALCQIHENYGDATHRIRADVIPHLRAIEDEAMQAVAKALTSRR